MINASGIWLALLLAGSLAYAVRLYMRSDYSTWESLQFIPALLFGRLLWRVQFTNSPPEEIRGGAILAANHRSSLDPVIVQLAARRRVHWMVAKEYCQHPAFSIVLQSLQVIPTNRTGTDINSTKLAIGYARRGSLVGMFPEGRLNETPAPLVSLRAGAALVALKAGVPILPIYIKGSPYWKSVISPLTMTAHVHVTFGPPIYPNDSSSFSSRSIGPGSNSDTESGAVIGMEVIGRDTGNDSELASAMIHRWGQSIAAMAGEPDFQVQVGSAARQRARTFPSHPDP